MAFHNIRPLHIMWQEGTELEMLDSVASGVGTVLMLANVFSEIPIKYLGTRRRPGWRNQDGALNPYQSLDWHIEQSSKKSLLPGYLNGGALLDSLIADPNRVIQPRYELVVVNEPLHWQDTSTRKIGGISQQNHGAIITTNCFQLMGEESEKVKGEKRIAFSLLVQMFVIHELCHVLGRFSSGPAMKDASDEELKASHCQNDCVMRWRLDTELIKKIANQPLCSSCREELPKFFIEP